MGDFNIVQFLFHAEFRNLKIKNLWGLSLVTAVNAGSLLRFTTIFFTRKMCSAKCFINQPRNFFLSDFLCIRVVKFKIKKFIGFESGDCGGRWMTLIKCDFYIFPRKKCSIKCFIN